MADNVILNSGSGGATLAADEIAAVHHQRVKVQYGADGSATDVSDSNPLPIDDAGGSLTIDAASLPLPTGAATAAGQLADGHNVTVDNASIPITAAALPLPSGAATAAAQLADGHNVTVDNASIAVTAAALPLPSGAATSAGQLADGHNVTVDNASLSVTNAGTFAVQADSVIPGTGATNLGKAVDGAAGATDTGIAALAVRDDSLSALTPADGDYVPLRVGSTGALHVTGGGGGTEYTEDVATANPQVGTATMIERDDALSAVTPAEGDWMGLRGTSRGALWVEEDSLDVVDTNNSTTSTLLANTDYTGTGTDILAYSGITIMVFADQNSDANGMRFEFSSDNSNWDISQTFDYIASTGRQFQFSPQAQYFRVAFQNGGTGQGAFRLQTILHKAPINPTTIHRIDADLAVDRSAEVVKSVIMAQAGGSGDFTPMQATNGGNFKVALEEYDGVPSGGGVESGSLRVTIANDSTGLVSVDDNGGALTVDNGGTFAVQSTLQTGSNLAADVGISGARTSGGTTLYKNIDVDESEDQVKGTAGQVYWIHAMNLSSAVKFLKLYNATAASVTVGTTVPDLTFPIPTQGDTNGAGFTLSIPNGIAFGTAITVAATTGVGDADSGAPGANEVIVNLGYA